MGRQRQGCLSGLMQLGFLTWIFDWLQGRFGFGRGASCSGMGCGVIMLCLFIIFACMIVGGTDWFSLRF